MTVEEVWLALFSETAINSYKFMGAALTGGGGYAIVQAAGRLFGSDEVRRIVRALKDDEVENDISSYADKDGKKVLARCLLIKGSEVRVNYDASLPFYWLKKVPEPAGVVFCQEEDQTHLYGVKELRRMVTAAKARHDAMVREDRNDRRRLVADHIPRVSGKRG